MNNSIYFANARSEDGYIRYIISAPTEIVCRSVITNQLKCMHDSEYLITEEEIENKTTKTLKDLLDMFYITEIGTANEKFNVIGLLYKETGFYNKEYVFDIDDFE